MKKGILLLLLQLSFVGGLLAQAGTVRDVDAYLNRYLEKIPVPGFSIVIVEGQKVVFSKGYGIERHGESKPMTPQSTLALGSLARGFTAVAIMQLVEEGVVDLDVPVVEYLPWFQTANKDFSDQITLRMCLSNTTGIPFQSESLPNLDDTSSSEEFLRSLNASFIKRKPGMSHEFSDEGYVIAGQVISTLSGQSYVEYMTEQVLRPLGMTRSTTDQDVADKMGIVVGHEMGLDRCHPAIQGVSDANYVAAGSEFYASAADLGNYMIALLNGGTYKGKRIVSSESVEEIFKPNTSFQGLGTMLGGNGIDIQYALGWMGMNIEERDILIHTGNNGNVASIMGLNRAKDQAFVILFNADVNRLDRFEYPGMEHTVNNVIHIINAEDTTDFGIMRPGQLTDEDYRLPKDKWHKYLGKYNSFGRSSPFFKNMNIEVYVGESGDIELISKREQEFKGQYRLEFSNESRATLRNIGFAREIQFSINPEGIVSGLYMFGTEFKKENDVLMAKFVTTTDPENNMSLRLPKSALANWNNDGLSVNFEENSEMSMKVDVAVLKSTDFETYLEDHLKGQNIIQKGIVNKEVLKKGIWTEQTVIVQSGSAHEQYHFAFYQDPISQKQMHLVLKCPWGKYSSELQEVISNVHRSVRFL